MMKKTNFDRYLEAQLGDPDFAARFAHAGQAWDVVLQIADLRRQAGLSQKELAARLHTSQQQISRLESPGYEGHSLSMLRRVAEALHARVRVVFELVEDVVTQAVAESETPYSCWLPGTESKYNARIAFEKSIAGMEDELAYLDDDASRGMAHQFRAADVDITRLREKLGLSQERFAALLGLSVRTVRNWEQGVRHPEGPARILLQVIDREPESVMRALRG